jgi:hypothetical protein
MPALGSWEHLSYGPLWPHNLLPNTSNWNSTLSDAFFSRLRLRGLPVHILVAPATCVVDLSCPASVADLCMRAPAVISSAPPPAAPRCLFAPISASLWEQAALGCAPGFAVVCDAAACKEAVPRLLFSCCLECFGTGFAESNLSFNLGSGVHVGDGPAKPAASRAPTGFGRDGAMPVNPGLVLDKGIPVDCVAAAPTIAHCCPDDGPELSRLRFVFPPLHCTVPQSFCEQASTLGAPLQLCGLGLDMVTSFVCFSSGSCWIGMNDGSC